MKTIGIIAEYNPFHNGHAYQIQYIKSHYPDSRIVVIMSGDFVQRGEPAIFNKSVRTKSALLSGADIVLELPVFFSCASAEYFASAAVQILAKLGVVDMLCFGAECDDLLFFETVSDLLLCEPTDYKQQLSSALKQGMSFPKARAIAVSETLNQPNYIQHLSMPNNILALEYMKALKKYKLSITPLIIKRQGNDYHDLSLDSDLCSASSIRNVIHQSTTDDLLNCYHALSKTMPSEITDNLLQSEEAKPLFWSDFYQILQYSLWQNKQNYSKFYDISEAISNKLSSYSTYPSSFEQLHCQLVSKNYTATRINRVLLSILLSLQQEDLQRAKNDDELSYVRILGLREDASSLLKQVKQKNQITLINKVANAYKELDQTQFPHFEKELSISTLYKQVYYNKYNIELPSEYEQSVIIIH